MATYQEREFAVSLDCSPGYTGDGNGTGDSEVRGAISAGELEKLVAEGENPQQILAVVLLEQTFRGEVTYTPYLRLSGNPRSWVAISKWRDAGLRSWGDPRRAVAYFRTECRWTGTSVLQITLDDPLARKLGPAGPFGEP